MKATIVRDKVNWLHKLYYDFGRQHTNYRVAIAYKDGEDVKFSKWLNYLDIQGNNNHAEEMNKINQRQQLLNEVIFEYDGKETGQWKHIEYCKLISRLRSDKMKFYAFCTNSCRACHIHTFWSGLAGLSRQDRQKFRESLISKYKCDMNFASDSHLISLEFSEHYKTGEIIKMVDWEEGINEVANIKW